MSPALAVLVAVLLVAAAALWGQRAGRAGASAVAPTGLVAPVGTWTGMTAPVGTGGGLVAPVGGGGGLVTPVGTGGGVATPDGAGIGVHVAGAGGAPGPPDGSAEPELPDPADAAHLDRAIVLDLAAAALAGGASVPDTLRALGRCGAGWELEFAGRSLLLGASFEEACTEVPARHRALLDALAPAWTAGADPAPLLRHAADVVRAGRRREAEVAAARLGVRLVVPLGLCHLPAFVALGLVPIVLSFVGEFIAG